MQKDMTDELTGHRTSAQMARDKRFKETALGVIEDSGANWSIHGLSVMKRTTIARVIYYHDLCQKCVSASGVICEFGVHWGAGQSTLLNLRSIFEPYNHSRHLFAFDTLEGIASTDSKDGGDVRVGDYSSRKDFVRSLTEIFDCREIHRAMFGERRHSGFRRI